MNREFANDIKKGLTSSPKTLLSKYLYDKKGSTLFSKIMKLPEYYLTDAELEIFQNQMSEILAAIEVERENHFELIELGAGDGFKTIEFLKFLEKEKYTYQYVPIDISEKALNQLEDTLRKQLPDKVIHPKKGDYFNILSGLRASTFPKVVLFLGSNMGNMTDDVAHSFLKKLGENLAEGDKLILGTDIKKHKEIVLPAYNDNQGVTRAFNLNLLERINRELDANFDISQFEHAPEYDENNGIAKSFIQSKTAQKVRIKAIDLTVDFESSERIHTEISRKYNDEILRKICINTGFEIIGKFMDSQQYFADYILEKKHDF